MSLVTLWSSNYSNWALNSTILDSTRGFFNKKLFIALWLSAALHSSPSFGNVDENPQSNQITTDIISVAPQKQEKLQIAKAVTWDSVSSFMLRSFWKLEGWNLLVEKWSWKRVLDPRKDLTAWKDYILARSEEEAQRLTKMFQKKSQTQQAKKEIPKYEIRKQVSFQDKLDYESFLKWITWIESSGWDYSVDTSHLKDKYNIKFEEIAFWFTQFTRETLASFWIVSEEDILRFKKSPKLQEELMVKLTDRNYNYALNSSYITWLMEYWVELHKILAAGHYMWIWWVEKVAKRALQKENPVEYFYKRTKKITDQIWRVSVFDYMHIVDSVYSKPWNNNIAFTNPETLHIETPKRVEQPGLLAKLEVPETVVNLIEQQKIETSQTEVYLPNQAANDEWINLRLDTELKSSNIDTTKSWIILTSWVKVWNVSQVATEHYRWKLIAELEKWEFTWLSKEAKQNLISTISGVEDFEAFYSGQVEAHRKIVSKKVIWLDDKMFIGFAKNTENLKNIQANNWIYNNSILPKLMKLNEKSSQEMNALLLQRIESFNMIPQLEKLRDKAKKAIVATQEKLDTQANGDKYRKAA